MLRSIKTLALIFVAAALLSASAFGAGFKSTPTSYAAHTFPRSEDFTTLEDWALNNYAEYLVDGSITSLATGEYPAISFRSLSETNPAHTEFNLLIDTGDSLVLLSSAPLKETPDFNSLDEAFGASGDLTGRTTTCDTATNRCNCVLYARCKVPSLPFGLTTYENKVAIINSYSPAVGYVAIMRVGLPYGHVAVVTGVTRDSRGNVTSISVNEANYSTCKITNRSGSPSTLKVTGYFRPR